MARRNGKTAPALPRRDRVKELRRVRAGDLIPNPANWRTHPKAQREALEAALAEIGWADALIARETPKGLMLLDGHLRADIDPDAKVPVLVLDVDEAEARKLLLTLDPLAGMAESNEEAARALLASTTFDLPALAKLAASLVPVLPAGGLTDPDAVPEPPKKPVSKRGTLWRLGKHRLLCGDSTSEEDVGRLTGGECDLVVTSPPYNCDINYESHDDDQPVAQYLEFIRAVVARSVAVLRAGCFVAWNVGVTPKSRHFDHAAALAAAGMDFYRQIVWAKAGVAFPIWQYTVAPRKYHPNYTHEVIFLFSKGKPAPSGELDRDDAYSRDVWEIHQSAATRDLPGETNGRRPRVSEHGGAKAAVHPAAFPVGIPRGAILHLSARGERVYDPFSGSGTTLIACEQLNRRCYAMEIEPRYVDVAVRRWEQFTGKKAERVKR